jgi:phage shock protein A
MSVEMEHDQYVTNLEGLVTARTEQLRAAVTKIEGLRAELEALKQTKSSHPADGSATTTQLKSSPPLSAAARLWERLFGTK